MYLYMQHVSVHEHVHEHVHATCICRTRSVESELEDLTLLQFTVLPICGSLCDGSITYLNDMFAFCDVIAGCNGFLLPHLLYVQTSFLSPLTWG